MLVVYDGNTYNNISMSQHNMDFTKNTKLRQVVKFTPWVTLPLWISPPLPIG